MNEKEMAASAAEKYHGKDTDLSPNTQANHQPQQMTLFSGQDEPTAISAAQVQQPQQPQRQDDIHPNFDMSQICDDPQAVQESSCGLFTIKKTSTWLSESSKQPTPKRLFGSLWFEHEMCILFADTGVGKSILAVQIGNAISKGESAMTGFPMEAEPQNVIYFDFELSAKQLEQRYSEDKRNDYYFNHYEFNDRFLRAEIDPMANVDGDYWENLNDSMISAIQRFNATVLIVDNMTWLSNNQEQSKDALPLMKNLKMLAKTYDVSVLVLAHTPKRLFETPITINDLAGSKMLSNFCDSCFAIGRSKQSENRRYLKQLKVRSDVERFGANNVVVCDLVKEEPANLLHFVAVNYGYEAEHLREVTEDERNEAKAKVKELRDRGLSHKAIADEVGISKANVIKWLNKIHQEEEQSAE